MSPLETIAALTGLACAWLTVKNRISNWPWGIASVLLYGVVFWQAKLYANALLQVGYFLPCCIYGWWAWSKLGPTHSDDLPVVSLFAGTQPGSRGISGRTAWFGWLALAVGLWWAIGAWLARHTDDPLPYSDAFVTATAIVAQYLQARKWYENWWLWIAGDLVCVAWLYPRQGLWVTTGLYAIFLAICCRGLVEWKSLLAQPQARAVEAER